MSATTTTAPTIGRIKDHNAEVGNYFFSRKTMKVFGSKVLPTVYHGEGGTYFVTSEDNAHKTAREFRVRKYNPETGDVRSAHNTGRAYESEPRRTSLEARQDAKRLAKEGEPAPILLSDEQRTALQNYAKFPKAPGHEQAAHQALGGKDGKYIAWFTYKQGAQALQVYEKASPINFIWI